MLKGIDPLLSPDLLQILAAMGHGDELAIVDRNFPAAATARRLVRLDGADLLTTARAVLSLLPLDDGADSPLHGMAVVESPADVPPVQQEILAAACTAVGRELTCALVERYAFYARAREAFAVIVTGEARPYGCVLFTKGVIF